MTCYGVRYRVTTRSEVGGEVTLFYFFVFEVCDFRPPVGTGCGGIWIGSRPWSVDGNGLLVGLVGFGGAAQLVFVFTGDPCVSYVSGYYSAGLPR